MLSSRSNCLSIGCRSAAYGSEQIPLTLRRYVTIGHTQKDVLYHVLSLTVIAQQDSGQMNHLAVVLAEELFKYSLFKHISLSNHCTPFPGHFYI